MEPVLYQIPGPLGTNILRSRRFGQHAHEFGNEEAIPEARPRLKNEEAPLALNSHSRHRLVSNAPLALRQTPHGPLGRH
jgi:hypothetical protein